MLRHDFDQEIHCPPDRFWELFMANDFNVEMYERGLGFPSCKIVERKETDAAVHRRMVMVPKVDLPRAVAKVVGDRVGYEEIGDWDKAKGVFRWNLILAAFGDKVRVGGSMKVVEHGAGHCKRVVDFEVEAKVFGIGKALEKTAAQNTLDGWKNSAAWINQWLAKNA